jgi:alkylation response protein AidB-like acyl-CoA dehydrogenase
MDFDFAPEDRKFRDDLQQFLREELPATWTGHYNESPEDFQTTLAIAGKMADRGWLTMSWPKEYGGGDASIWQQVVMKEEMWANKEPRGPQYMSTNWIGPSILMYGTEEQKKQHIGAISRGRSLWAQGFSEPDAGSDLASLKTRAVRDGDEYIINGEKIWTSHTPHAEWIFLLTRSDPEAPKHKGISVFLIPIKHPGIQIVPIRSMVGYGEFAHVYFEDCRVPASWRLGAENEGWKVTVTALSYERMGAPRFISSIRKLEALAEYARSAVSNGKALYDDPLVRQRFAQLYTEAEAARLLYYRVVSHVARDDDVTMVGAVARIHGTLSNQKVPAFAMELLGGAGDVQDESSEFPFHGHQADEWLKSLTASIAAGTTEVNKNVIAQRGLGLPRGS